jgi:hypothetical protein
MTGRTLFHRDSDMTELLQCVLSAASILLLFWSAASHAQIYKCTDSEGNGIYTQTPCSSEPSIADKVDSSSVAPLDCRHASRFAAWTARLMQGGARSDEVFDRYGGINSLSKGSISVINYVYSFRTNDDVTVERIAGLAQAKCTAKSFGDARCETLPLSFTDSLGGCDSNGESVSAPDMPSANNPPDTSSTNRLATASEQTIRSRSATNVQKCKKIFRDQIDVIDAQMRSGYSSEQGETYRQELRLLTQELRKCEGF